MKILIFIVSYNAEKHICDVISRIPKEYWDKEDLETEILIIDDCSKDNTVKIVKDYLIKFSYPVTVLNNKINQGYGGNQKIGYTYAIKNNFDIVVLLHGDGQYPPEKINEMILPIINGEADVVFGSRMIKKKQALKGGMPYYKYVGNKILTYFQNFILSMNLSEFHSGYRAYRINKLMEIPFKYNSNDFDFDTDIIIQLNHVGAKFYETPIPTHYGEEKCYVNGFKYAFQILRTTFISRFQKYGIFYKRKFDYEIERTNYESKITFNSSHKFAIDHIKPNSIILDIGCSGGHIGKALIEQKQCKIHGIDKIVSQDIKEIYNSVQQLNIDNEKIILPDNIEKLDYVLLLDVLENLKSPEMFLDELRELIARYNCECIITTGNVGFFITRFALLFGQFNYGKRGILDLTHKRLFTFRSLKHLLNEEGFKIIKKQGIIVPIPFIIKNNKMAKILTIINILLIKLSRNLFSYQIAYVTKPLPTLNMLLKDAEESKNR